MQSVPVGGGSLTAIGNQEIGGGIFALDDTFVYWTEYPGAWPGAAQLMKTPRAGGPTTVIVTDAWYPIALAVNDGYLYWTEFTDSDIGPQAPSTGGVRRAAVSGGATEALFTAHDITCLAFDDAYVYFVDEGVYWVDPGNGTLMKLAK